MKFKMKSKAMIVLMLVLVLVLTACGNSKDNNDAPKDPATETGSENGNYNEKDAEYIIKFATSLKASELDSLNPGGVAIRTFKEYVEKETDGKVMIKLFLGGQLASTNEDRVNGLRSGAFEMENLNTGSWSEYSNAYTALNAPYLFLNADIANEVLAGKVGQSMNEQLLADTGIRNLGFINIGYRQLTNSIREVKSPDDVNGLKIRTMSDPYQIETWKALGSTVTPTAYSELYTALQQGMVDGQENPLTNLYTSGMYEIQPYLTLTAHNCSFVTAMINEDYFQSLPEEYQKVLIDAGQYSVDQAKEVFEDAEETIIEAIKSDTQVYRPTIDELKAFKNSTKSVREVMLKKEIGEEYFNFIMDEISEVEKELGI